MVKRYPRVTTVKGKHVIALAEASCMTAWNVSDARNENTQKNGWNRSPIRAQC